jgi:hypothetical protein
MTSATQQLRQRGFRPLPEGPGSEVFSRRAQDFGYDVIADGTVLWIRKQYRKKGSAAPTTVAVGQPIRSNNLTDPALRSPLAAYQKTRYASLQARIASDRDDLIEAIGWHREEEEVYRKLNSISKPLSFCSPQFLPQFAFEHALPAFFEFDPQGTALIVSLNEEMERPFGLVRGAYALRHASLSTLQELNKGVPSLRAWEQGLPTDYLDPLLSIIQVVSYPFIQIFHGGPIGLSIVFILSTPQRHEPGHFPRSWLHWARSDSGFAMQSMDRLKGLADPESREFDQLVHHRYQFGSSIEPLSLEAFLRWSLDRLNYVIRETSDPANFIDKAGAVDFTFCFEHNLTLIRVLKLVLQVAATEELPQGKLRAFEVADVLEGLARAHRGGAPGEFFKFLFTPDRALDVIKSSMKSLPEGVRGRFELFAEILYRQLRDTAIASIWLTNAVTDSGIIVKSKDLKNQEIKSVDDYTGELVRALRNTHHGYFTHLDPANRPSRYLAISTGDLPDGVSSLPLVWVLALLSDPITLIGWEPLAVGEYE